MADTRYRNFTAIVYPDSAPENWMSILGEMCIPCFISPLHDKDVNLTGEPKKPHYHVILCFEGKKSIAQAKEIFDNLKAVYSEKEIVVQSIRGAARYLCHLDNPEKAQYSESDVIAYAGADYPSTIGLVTDKYRVIGEMIDFCEANNIISYAQLLTWCRKNKFEWFRVLCDSGTYVIKEYLKSMAWEINNNLEVENDD